jgi:hypothetical protein
MCCSTSLSLNTFFDLLPFASNANVELVELNLNIVVRSDAEMVRVARVVIPCSDFPKPNLFDPNRAGAAPFDLSETPVLSVKPLVTSVLNKSLHEKTHTFQVIGKSD